ncbi:uncharacterized protein EV422DRAFT_522127 [Fimicolochytrium jonesii]|uniref:uncharacterized protein n=1 Tax=Fimicolochytrium jonesii TaxID=1396493 RepID=UPI0022FE7702|nr:uncharacterized protein EV422DRAFT_522127 [Fimicolochytrium jonesii]KAI8823729.1 hypothetical protein EV422DRAFT_522127 [Fimicolochytrium jonesii]
MRLFALPPAAALLAAAAAFITGATVKADTPTTGHVRPAPDGYAAYTAACQAAQAKLPCKGLISEFWGFGNFSVTFGYCEACGEAYIPIVMPGMTDCTPVYKASSPTFDSSCTNACKALGLILGGPVNDYRGDVAICDCQSRNSTEKIVPRLANEPTWPWDNSTLAGGANDGSSASTSASPVAQKSSAADPGLYSFGASAAALLGAVVLGMALA